MRRGWGMGVGFMMEWWEGDGDGEIAHCLGDTVLMNTTKVDRVTHPTELKNQSPVCLSVRL